MLYIRKMNKITLGKKKDFDLGNIGKSLVKVEESGRERKKTSQRQYTQKQKAASVQKTKKYHFNLRGGS